MSETFEKKMSYNPGGIFWGYFLYFFVTALTLGIGIGFIIKPDNLTVPIVILIAILFTILWYTVIKISKPYFNKLTFSNTEIFSQSKDWYETLKVEDIKGIWFMSNGVTHDQAKAYYPGKAVNRNSIIIFGDLEAMNYAKYTRLRGHYFELIDTFGAGYTTIKYRKNKEFVELLDYYYNQMKNKA